MDNHLLLQMRKAADQYANAVDVKLAEMAAAQRQIGEHVAELQGVVESNYEKSAKDTKQAMDRVRDDIMGALVGDTSQLVDALDLNENVAVLSIDDSRYLLFIF